jgi:uncharacterized repeat protein (TIGR03803 family)
LEGVLACAFISPAPAADAARFKETGQSPTTSLVAVKGVLYGTTQNGGNGNDSEDGGAFAIDPSTGAETVVYDFCSQKGCADGDQPRANLIEVGGKLYGTTLGGGAYGCGNGHACGTLFSLDPATGVETVLHSFGASGDGKYPQGGLLALNGALYGTTYAGGHSGYGSFGCGPVFSVDISTGAVTVLYDFCSQANCADGAESFAGLIELGGVLYGTTEVGGGVGCGGAGCGTVFSLDTNTSAESVLYSFCSQANCVDGETPKAPLSAVHGKLYGTTFAGGADGDGTVFELHR